jgi:hypothetical protein
MARRPNDFTIARINTTPDPRARYIPVSPTSVVPDRFFAEMYLSEIGLVVGLTVRVAIGGRPRVTEINVESSSRTPLTSTLLRRIPLESLTREAMAAVPAGARRDGGVKSGGGDRTACAAAFYAEAQASGNQAPTVTVAAALGCSRAQASRYIRAARESGLLPPVARRTA